jgi:NTP pyrophosphatase (non-canonical NTP hydrolase)
MAEKREITPEHLLNAIADYTVHGTNCSYYNDGDCQCAVEAFRHTLRKALARPAVAVKTLNDMAREVLAINTANGWNVLKPEEWDDTYKVPTVLALIHSEVSEALEGFRHGDKANFAEELADIQIRLLDCAGGLGIDLDAEVAAKMTKNRSRGFRHGGKRV